MATNAQLTGHTDLLEVVIGELPEKGVQYRLSITEFREVNYLSVREWYASYDNSFAPSNNGFTMPYNMASVTMLFKALTTLLSQAEVLDQVIEDKTFLTPLVQKASLVDELSKLAAIPADYILESIENIEVTEDNKFILSFKDPKGSPWLKK